MDVKKDTRLTLMDRIAQVRTTRVISGAPISIDTSVYFSDLSIIDNPIR